MISSVASPPPDAAAAAATEGLLVATSWYDDRLIGGGVGRASSVVGRRRFSCVTTETWLKTLENLLQNNIMIPVIFQRLHTSASQRVRGSIILVSSKWGFSLI